MKNFKLTLYTSRPSRFCEVAETVNGWEIDAIPVLNTPVPAADLRPGDMFTQLSLDDTPENLWVVESVGPSPVRGNLIYMTSGGKLYAPAHARYWLQYRAE